MVFIRAPRITRVGSGVTVLATHEGEPVLVEQGGVMAGSFHPELTDDGAVHRRFLSKLTKGEAAPARQQEANTEIDITETLAIQHLAKLFPVRNRLGPAPARVQASDLLIREGEDHRDQEILELLETSSILLFGHPEWPVSPSVRSLLRSSTLRRQLQIIDAIHAARVDAFIKRPGQEDSASSSIWAKTFEAATWSLLNVHRDVLREFNLNLDDLYSWTPQGLRQVLLGTILRRTLEERRKLLKRWRYRTEDRRSDLLSLLAANVFRPRMAGEEPSGDDPDAVRAHRRRSEGPPEMPEEDTALRARSFSVRKGMLWFLNLMIGFYLPQILARNRPDDIALTDPDAGRIRGVGWTLLSGPIHGVREALTNKEIFSIGMLLLDPVKAGKSAGEHPKLNLLIHLWCFYGFERGVFWSAVSLWRGLGLLGQILIADVRLREADLIRERPQHLRALLSKHCQAARVPGALRGGSMARERASASTTSFRSWSHLDASSEWIDALARRIEA